MWKLLSVVLSLSFTGLASGQISKVPTQLLGPSGSKVKINLNGSITIQSASGQPIGIFGSTTRLDGGPLVLGALSNPPVSGATDANLYWDGSNVYISKNGGVYTLFGAGGGGGGGGVVPINTVAAANQFFTGYNGVTGAFTRAQPAFSDLSGTAAIGQIPTGSSGTTVALGNHLHTGVYQPAGTYASAAQGTLADTALQAAQIGSVVQGYDATTTKMGNTATGTGSVVRATSPALVTPVLGVATGTSLTLSGAITASNFSGTAVSLSGAPVTGNLAKFTSSTAIGPVQDTSGNLDIIATGNITLTPGSTKTLSLKQAIIADATDPTKRVQETVSAVSTGTTRFNSHPDADTTAVVSGQSAPAGQWFSSFNANGTFGSSVPNATDIQPNEFVIGNANAVVTNSGTIDTIKLATALTQTRTYTIPNADLYPAGATLRFYDASGSPTSSIVARIVSASGNTFNGNTALDISESYFNRVLVADPVSHNWTVSTFGGSTGSGLAIAPYTAIPVVSTTATLACNANVPEQHNILILSGNYSLAITGAINGTTGRIWVKQDGTGSRALTLPTGSKTPANGLGVLTLSTAANAEDNVQWSFDGTNYSFTVLGLNYTASVPATYSTVADSVNGTTAGTTVQGSGGAQRWLATRLVANGGVATGSTYTVGKVRLRVLKTGSPVTTLHCAIYSDNGAGAPGTLVGTASTGVSASTFATSEGDIDFAPLATLTSGTTYFVLFYAEDISRSVNNGVTNATTTITSATANFVSSDVGATITGTGIPTGTTIVSVTNSTTVVLSAAATTTATNVNLAIGAGSSTNNTSWAYQTITSTGVQASYSSTTGGTWTGTGLTKQSKFITYK